MIVTRSDKAEMKGMYSKKPILHKTIAISGSTGGLGQALCEHIAALGGNIIMLDRNKEKAASLAARIKGKYPDTVTEYYPLDLEDFESVKQATNWLTERAPDYIILNAGAYSIPRHKTALGYDNVFQINYLSPYYIARRLLPEIEGRGGRIVAVGSIAHNYSKTDEDDIDFSKHTRASRVYGNAKRRLMFSLFALDSRSITVTHPGITLTGITAHYPKLIFAIIKHPMKVIFMSPKKASKCILEGLFSETHGNEWIGPRFFGIWGRPKKTALTTCTSDEQERISALSDKLFEQLNS
ncbi:MAG: SDR family NAD(P)-dependent oxidoreductase [Clostridia bacterium]|nr:SDR family NAD(P)-dependent oxidoreductase [Clostridia bacterium]